jgi:hypothetical protein
LPLLPSIARKRMAVEKLRRETEPLRNSHPSIINFVTTVMKEEISFVVMTVLPPSISSAATLLSMKFPKENGYVGNADAFERILLKTSIFKTCPPKIADFLHLKK